MSKYKYLIPEYNGEKILANAYVFETTTHEDNKSILAEEAAEDYYHRGGYESSWPIVFHIYNEENKKLGKFEVDRRSEPVFEAKRLK